MGLGVLDGNGVSVGRCVFVGTGVLVRGSLRFVKVDVRVGVRVKYLGGVLVGVLGTKSVCPA